MRWPFMLRATHDALMQSADARHVAMCDLVQRVTTERDSIMAEHRQFVATIAERATPRAIPVTPPKPPRERDSADVAVETAAAFDPRRRRYLEQFVRERRAAGVAAEDIAQAILHPPATGYGEWEMPE